MTIHREGYSTLILILFVGLAINIPVWVVLGNTWLSYVLTGTYIIILAFIMRFFRYPKRTSGNRPEAVLSPADGKIIALQEEKENEYFKDLRFRVSIFMSGFNVHANWIPVSGSIEYFRYHPGRNLLAVHPKSSDLNERSSMVIKLENNQEILIRQIAGLMARRVVTYPKSGQVVKQGEELGFIKFGSRVDIFLPPGAKPLVKLGDKVKGNLSEIAAWHR